MPDSEEHKVPSNPKRKRFNIKVRSEIYTSSMDKKEKKVEFTAKIAGLNIN